MSRRLRLEEEKAKLLNQDIQEEEDKLKLMQAKIFGPIVWRRLASGIHIQDLHSNRYEEVIEIIENCYIKEDVLFRNTEIADDPVSMDSFRDRLICTMDDHSSLVAVDVRNSDTVVGALLLKAVKKGDFGSIFSRVMMTHGDAFLSIIEFINFISRNVDIFEQFQCESFLEYYLLCVRPEYRGSGLGYQLMCTGIGIAKHLKIPVIGGIFDCYSLQKLAKRLGMEPVFQLEYTAWSGNLKLCDLGPGNYTCDFMAGFLETALDSEEEQEEDEEEITNESEVKEPLEPPPKLTRTEKRKIERKKAERGEKTEKEKAEK